MATRTKSQPARAKADAAPRSPSIPLRYRARNPPPVFVGRAEERALLAQTIERAPITVVCGPGGIGKTALVLATLAIELADRLPRTVMIEMRPDEPPEELASSLVRALAGARGVEHVAWSGALGDREALLAAAIDLADEGDLWVVIDDLHHGDPEAVRELLQGVVRYARAARWIATSRADPALGELLGQTLMLSSMSDADLTALSAALAPGLNEIGRTRAVASAGGSPWRLRQALSRAEAPAGDAAAIAALTAGDRAFLRALTMFERPLSTEAVARVTPLPNARDRALLERRGLIEQGAEGVRLHDVARALVTAADPSAIVRPLDAARALAGSADSAAGAEALRLAVQGGDLDLAVSILDAHLAGAIAEGLASRLFQGLTSIQDPRFLKHKRALAVEIGGGAALAWAAREPPSDDAADRRLHAQALLLAGKPSDAVARATALAAELRDAGDARASFAATAIVARALVMLGKPVEALEALDARDVDRAIAQRDPIFSALRAKALVNAGKTSEALAEALALAARLDDLDPRTRVEVEDLVTTVLMNTGRLAVVTKLIDAEAGGPNADLLRWQRARARRSLVLLESGRLDEGAAELDKIAPFAKTSPPQRLLFRMNQLRSLMSEGALDAVPALAEEMLADAEATGSADYYAWGMLAHAYAALLLSDVIAPAPWSAAMPRPRGPQALYVAAYRARLALRAGEEPAPDDHVDLDAIPDVIDLQVAARVYAAELRATEGDLDAAAREGRLAVALAAEHGWALWEADARFTLADVLIVGDRFDELAAVARDLTALAAKIGSPRYEAEAAIVAAAAERAIDPAELERIAALARVSPIAARRARACLTGGEGADAIDRRVVAALERRAAGRVERITSGVEDKAWRPGWGLDPRRREAWLPGGKRVDLSQNPLFYRLLDAIARRGGRASKEDLAKDVWEIDGYHPLRDDKRIQVAVRRLRMAIEDKASEPARLITIDDGYGFGDAEPVRWFVASPAA